MLVPSSYPKMSQSNLVYRIEMTTLKLEQAVAIIDAAIAEGRRLKLAPLAVAVLDAGGHLVAFKREDGASFARFQIANGKAWGALGMGFGTEELSERGQAHPAFVSAISTATQGRMIPSPGGVLIEDKLGEVIGAVGISGDVGSKDAACALVAIKSIGFVGISGLRKAKRKK